MTTDAGKILVLGAAAALGGFLLFNQLKKVEAGSGGLRLGLVTYQTRPTITGLEIIARWDVVNELAIEQKVIVFLQAFTQDASTGETTRNVANITRRTIAPQEQIVGFTTAEVQSIPGLSGDLLFAQTFLFIDAEGDEENPLVDESELKLVGTFSEFFF